MPVTLLAHYMQVSRKNQIRLSLSANNEANVLTAESLFGSG